MAAAAEDPARDRALAASLSGVAARDPPYRTSSSGEAEYGRDTIAPRRRAGTSTSSTRGPGVEKQFDSVRLDVVVRASETAYELFRAFDEIARNVLASEGKPDALDDGEVRIRMEEGVPELGVTVVPFILEFSRDFGYALLAHGTFELGKHIVDRWRERNDLAVRSGGEHIGEPDESDAGDAQDEGSDERDDAEAASEQTERDDRQPDS